MTDLELFVKNDGLLRPRPTYVDVVMAGPNFDRLSRIGSELVPANHATEYDTAVKQLRTHLLELSGDGDSGKYCNLYVDTHRRARKSLLQLIYSFCSTRE
jgi:hypothetical protein